MGEKRKNCHFVGDIQSDDLHEAQPITRQHLRWYTSRIFSVIECFTIMLMLYASKNLTIMLERRHYYASVCSHKKRKTANIYP